ncbi:hypothetical protein PILCRDRAFT_824646 [Piloderma croceum F 1598]|uniref:Aminoglycoside phosphotransferase domain-containing protein n=1 Tax=Piloderma croceum (strain F 1598) TaxID=765440 RepID=A0A0C3AVZ2_PILCF|nr:hypothetical protein PILCRDRAFT_824646 [Piloderma croceum F 1598]
MADMLSYTLVRFSSLSHSQTTTTEPSPSEDWTDDEIRERMKTAPPLPDAIWNFHDIVPPPGNYTGPVITGYSIVVLCQDTVVKRGISYYLDPEVRALDFVRRNTSIPVPKIRRYITSETSAYILLEKIEGTRLDKLWPSYSPLQRFLTAWILRGYILELREASSIYHRCHVPGPMADVPRYCHGPHFLFGDRNRGPFEHSRQLLDYFGTRSWGSGPRFDDSYNSQPLVLTHNDLSMRNIVVGHDGKLWLVDWGWSGFYPPFCEYIATKSAAYNDKAPKSWWKYIPLITGAWPKEEMIAAGPAFVHIGPKN